MLLVALWAACAPAPPPEPSIVEQWNRVVPEPTPEAYSAPAEGTAPGAPVGTVRAPGGGACLTTWWRENSRSILNEQRGSAKVGWSDFHTAAVAAPIGPEHVAVKHTERFQLDGRPIFWFTPDFQTLVVDEKAFGALTVVDVPSAPHGEHPVGTVTAAARAALGDRGVVELLIASDTLRTYWHTGSETCLVAERADAGRYEADVFGEHVYFTNEESHDAYQATVVIAADGAITLISR